LIPEKGIATMIEAWQRLGGLMPLKIIGDGPLRDKVIAASRSTSTIEWLGRRSSSEVLALLSAAEMTIFPSEWPEAFGRTIVESFAVGTPVVAARVAAVPELVCPNRTGRLFEPANAVDLAREIKDLVANPQQLRAMRRICRRTYVTHYTQRQNYPLLLAAYRHALGTLPRPVRRASACGSDNRSAVVQAPRG
jgi:glycosyltransferase involved in cell wall biosynthesis